MPSRLPKNWPNWVDCPVRLNKSKGLVAAGTGNGGLTFP